MTSLVNYNVRYNNFGFRRVILIYIEYRITKPLVYFFNYLRIYLHNYAVKLIKVIGSIAEIVRHFWIIEERLFSYQRICSQKDDRHVSILVRVIIHIYIDYNNE